MAGATRHALLLALLAAASGAARVPRAHARVSAARAPRAAPRLSGGAPAAAPAEMVERAAAALRAVTYNALGPAALLAGVASTDVVSLGLVQPSELSIDPTDGAARLELRTRLPRAPEAVALARACEAALVVALGVPCARVALSLSSTPSSSGQASAGLQQVAHVVGVGSCKGGVGKSTIAVNLAFALSALGARVGLVDVDIYGPSLPTMVTPESAAISVIGSAILPLERDGVLLMSIGWVNPHSMLLRGAKIAPLVEQMVGQTAWGPLDYLIVDLPPGTGDVQLALSQSIRLSGAVLVTTPQRLSFVDVVKGVELFQKVAIPTLAVVENMASYTPPRAPAERVAAFCDKHGLGEAARAELERELLDFAPPDFLNSGGQPPASGGGTGARSLRLFGEGHIERLREMWGIDAAFSLPLLPGLAQAGDSGIPHVVSHPSSEASALFLQLAAALDREVFKNELRQQRQAQTVVAYDAEANEVAATIGGVRYALSPQQLRRKCRSPVNAPDACPPGLAPVEIEPMGNYAVSVVWSDGHQSLFPYATFTGDF